MKLFTRGDFIDSYVKIRQQGLNSILSKLGFNKITRIKNNWNEKKHIGGFWNIPFFMAHWNKVITGDSTMNYPQYFCDKYLSAHKNYSLLSIGSGTGLYEREFAKQKYVFDIIGIELSENRVREAEKLANENNLDIKYLNQNIYEIDFKNQKFDIILFNSSLHHFDNMDLFLSQYIKPLLAPNGFLLICEYVGRNRIYIPNFQLKEANNILKKIPSKYRQYEGIPVYKNKVYSNGLLRMKLNDPSEAVDSESIIPVLHKYFDVVEEKYLGCNLIMPIMRGIAHNFINKDTETIELLQMILEADTNFIEKYDKSDFIFGVYQ